MRKHSDKHQKCHKNYFRKPYSLYLFLLHLPVVVLIEVKYIDKPNETCLNFASGTLCLIGDFDKSHSSFAALPTNSVAILQMGMHLKWQQNRNPKRRRWQQLYQLPKEHNT